MLQEIRKLDLMDDDPSVADFYVRALARPAWQRTLRRYAERLGADEATIA